MNICLNQYINNVLRARPPGISRGLRSSAIIQAVVVFVINN